MSDKYISQEAAKKELCELCSDFTMCTRSDNDCLITRRLNSLPAADVVERPRWIPVLERLPEDNEMVLCFTPVDGFMFVGFHFSYKWGSNMVSKWRIITAMRSTKDITKKVTHWQPLPEPPKEEA